MGIAVDGAGAVYVLHSKLVDVNQAKTAAELWKLEPGATSATVTPLNDVRLVLAIAADRPGNVYVADAAGRRVLKYAPGATDPTDLAVPEGTPNALAVDESGAVYVAAATAFSDAAVFRYAAGGATPEKLPVTGVHWTPGSTVGLGVDSAGNVYLGDADHDRVVEIPRGDWLDRRVGRGRVDAAQTPREPLEEVLDLVARVVVRIRIHQYLPQRDERLNGV